MSKINKEIIKSVSLCSVLIALGMLEFIAMVFPGEWSIYLTSGGDLLSGLFSIFIGIVFLAGAKESNAGREPMPYLIVGCLLVAFMATVSLLTMGANAVEVYLLGNGDLVGWSPIDDYSPFIVLAVPCIMMVLRWVALPVAGSRGRTGAGGSR